jgi:hypothetical protein
LDAGSTAQERDVGDTGTPPAPDTGIGPDGNGMTPDVPVNPDASTPGDTGGTQGPDAQVIPDSGLLRDSGVSPISLQIVPDFISIPLGTTQGLDLNIQAGIPAVWTVDGVTGGDPSVGTIQTLANDVRAATYSAPRQATTVPVTRVINAHTFGGIGTALITLIAPAPTVTSVAPTRVDLGAPDTPIVIDGDGFVSSTLVELDGVALSIQVQTWSRIEAVIPASLLNSAGVRRLVIRSPAPGGGTESIPFTVVLRDSIIGANLPANIAALFNAANSGSNAALRPQLRYPEDSSYAPRDFPSPRFSWSQASTNNVCRLSLRSSAVALDVYVSSVGLAANENPNVQLQASYWTNIVSTSVQEISLSHTVACAELSGGSLVSNTIYESTAQTYYIVPDDAGGKIVYFSGLVEGLWNIDIEANQATAIPWIGPNSAFRLDSGTCVGCHSFSRNGQKMSYAIRDPDWSLELTDIATSTPTVDVAGSQGSEAVWTAMHPDGSYVLVTNLAAQLVLLDGTTGQVVTQVPTAAAGMNATQAFWSPVGDAFAFVTGTEGINGVTDFAGGEIWTMSFTNVGGQIQFGAPVRIAGPDVIGGTAYYPAYSPDGEYLVFCRAPSGSSYNNPDATLWLAKSDGSTAPVHLGRANQTSNISNSWPRWAPSTSNGRYWLLFSSQRNYPPYIGTGPQQLWVSLIDPNALPADPSSAAIWLSGQEPFTGNLTAEWTVSQ